jgi:hypothetical protein
MNEFRLSDELIAVEKTLADFPLGEPSTDLRFRVLQSIHHPNEVTRTGAAGAPVWSFFVGLAAAIAIWANLSTTALNYGVTNYGITMAVPLPAAELDRQAGFLHDLAPDFSRDDARRQIARMKAGLRSSPPRISHTQLALTVR